MTQPPGEQCRDCGGLYGESYHRRCHQNRTPAEAKGGEGWVTPTEAEIEAADAAELRRLMTIALATIARLEGERDGARQECQQVEAGYERMRQAVHHHANRATEATAESARLREENERLCRLLEQTNLALVAALGTAQE